jgi:hypothetical protein
MIIDGAIVKERGQVFAIVIVKPSVISNPSAAAETRAALQASVRDFAGLELILASQDSSGAFQYRGRSDIVDFLASIDASRIPWRRYTVS